MGSDDQLTVDSVERTFQVHVPPNVASPAPLLLVLHGGAGTGTGMRRMTEFDRVADQHGFIVAYPDGLNRSWNDKRGSGHAARSGADDVKFISMLIDHLVQHDAVDSKRVYVTGMSNGGMMTYRLACDLSDKISGFAAVTANISADFAKNSQSPRPVRLLIMNGTDDPIMPYHGGSVSVFQRELGSVLSTDETIAFWTKANGCTDKPVEEALPDKVPDDGTQVYVTRYSACSGNGEVVLYRIQGGGHTWPKAVGGQYLPQRRIGRVSRELDAAQTIWSFLSQSGGKVLPSGR